MWVIHDDKLLGNIPDWDRAQQFGDGLFETIKIQDGHPVALDLHLKRCNEGLSRLNIVLHDDLKAHVLKLISRLISQSGIRVPLRRQCSARDDGLFKRATPIQFRLLPSRCSP